MSEAKRLVGRVALDTPTPEREDSDATAYEPARLLRGSHLAVMRLGAGEYAVQGSHGVRYVNLNADPPCDCEDMAYRNAAGTGVCKHIAAARLHDGDMGLLQSLGNMLLARQRASGDEDETVEDEAQRGRHGEP